MKAFIRNGEYYLSGWIGWSIKALAERFDLVEAEKKAAKLRSLNFNVRVEPIQIPSRRRTR